MVVNFDLIIWNWLPSEISSLILLTPYCVAKSWPCRCNWLIFKITDVILTFLLMFIDINIVEGGALKVACVSAAVSDESVAGDSGVYEASVKRYFWLSYYILKFTCIKLTQVSRARFYRQPIWDERIYRIVFVDGTHPHNHQDLQVCMCVCVCVCLFIYLFI